MGQCSELLEDFSASYCVELLANECMTVERGGKQIRSLFLSSHNRVALRIQANASVSTTILEGSIQGQIYVLSHDFTGSLGVCKRVHTRTREL